MRFSRAHKKVIALTVIFAFLYLLQVSSHPLHAAKTPDPSPNKQTLNSEREETGMIEQESTGIFKMKKHSILPIIVGVVAVAAVVAVLVLVVAKSKYDITGKWTFVMTAQGGNALDQTWDPVTFTGSKKSGTYQIQNYGDGAGSYTVDGKNVSMKSTFSGYNWTFTGTFTDANTMSGTSTFIESGNPTPDTWNWTATKQASATSVPKTPMNSGKKLIDTILKKH